MQRLSYMLACLGLCLLLGGAVVGQVFDERFDDWPLDLKINGRLIVAAEPSDLNLLDDLLASDHPRGECLLIAGSSSDPAVQQPYHALFETVSIFSIDQLVELPPRSVPEFVAWHIDSAPLASAEFVEPQRVATELAAQLAAGKTVIVTGSAADMIGKFFSPAKHAEASPSGFDLLPDCILELDFSPDQSRPLLDRVTRHKRCVGIGLEPHTLLLLDGRQLRVAGAGRVWMMLPRGAGLPSRIETLAPRRSRRQPAPEWLGDLTAWRRDAIDRTLEPFPPAQPQLPSIEQGTLVIVGGGGMPAGLMQRFVDLAGGAQAARLVYIPCAEQERVPPRSAIVDAWQALGVQQTSTLHTKDRQQANSDRAFLAPLNAATGIWFGGGRQWNLADSYYGTEAHRLMKQVLKRGGVIGGSSAGASIQARYLARATPIENLRLMAPGYERGGLGFLSGVAIDQHFSQRGRHTDMMQLVARYPQLLGIGIDEATALVVQGTQAEITGQGAVYFYDRQPTADRNPADYIKAAAGEVYDLARRQITEKSCPAD